MKIFLGKDGNGEAVKSVSRDLGSKRTDTQKPEPLPSVLHYIEAYALVMLCNYRLSIRRLSVLILRDVKILLKALGCSDDQAVIDVMDQYCPHVIDKCIPFLPATEKAAVQAISNIDLQWLSERTACVWTAGFYEDENVKSSPSFNLATVDAWSTCLFGFLERERVLTLCPSVISHSWSIVFTRVNTLFPVIDPTYVILL